MSILRTATQSDWSAVCHYVWEIHGLGSTRCSRLWSLSAESSLVASCNVLISAYVFASVLAVTLEWSGNQDAVKREVIKRGQSKCWMQRGHLRTSAGSKKQAAWQIPYSSKLKALNSKFQIEYRLRNTAILPRHAYPTFTFWNTLCSTVYTKLRQRTNIYARNVTDNAGSLATVVKFRVLSTK